MKHAGRVCTLPALIAFFVGLGFWAAPVPSAADERSKEPGWSYPLVKKGKLGSPLVEVTPFVFGGRLYLLENWQKQWDFPGSPDGSRFEEDEVRIRDVEKDEIVSIALVGRGLGMALVWEDRVYVFAGNWGDEKKWNIRRIEMTWSNDLIEWSEPVGVLEAEADEKFFNVSVCRGPDAFVMLVESNDPAWPAFTFKYFKSQDLVQWRPVPDALYGREKYVGGPALYFAGGYYYTLYLHSLGRNRYETRVTRSRDLVHWQDAPEDRPFVTFDPEQPVHPLRPPEVRESNASDAELCAWQSKTLIYFTGGDQRLAGDLQSAEFEGSPRDLLERFYEEPNVVLPSAGQARYQENQLGCFVHFGTATFVEGGDMHATPGPALFNPAELDAEQWMRAAQAIGAKHIVLTAKHHSGFCLWPTATTDYSVKNSPWKDGRGDVVAEFVAAARKYGIDPGLYISAGDRHFGCTSTPDPMGRRKLIGDADAYFPIFMRQLEELLGNYGDLVTVWFDGAYDPFGWDVKTSDGSAAGERYGPRIVSLVRRLQPGAAIFGGVSPDIRWAGNEAGRAPYPLWNVIEIGGGPANWLPPDAAGWYICEANLHTRAGWFWTPDSDRTLRSVDSLLDVYRKSIGRGANLLVNLTPDRRGLIPDVEFGLMKRFGEEVERQYGAPAASMSSDGLWREGNVLELDLGEEREVDHITIEEDLRAGQRIRKYRVDAMSGGEWKNVIEGESIGRKRIEHFKPIRTDRLRLRIIESDPLPRIRLFGA